MVEKHGACGFGTLLAKTSEEECVSSGKHSHGRKRIGGLGLLQALLLSAVVMMMRKRGLFPENDIRRIAFENPAQFYGGSSHFNINV